MRTPGANRKLLWGKGITAGTMCVPFTGVEMKKDIRPAVRAEGTGFTVLWPVQQQKHYGAFVRGLCRRAAYGPAVVAHAEQW